MKIKNNNSLILIMVMLFGLLVSNGYSNGKVLTNDMKANILSKMDEREAENNIRIKQHRLQKRECIKNSKTRLELKQCRKTLKESRKQDRQDRRDKRKQQKINK